MLIKVKHLKEGDRERREERKGGSMSTMLSCKSR
jgi:hypothetical protein